MHSMTQHNEPPIKIRRQNRRSLMMRRTYNGLEVFIPHWLSPDDSVVRKFIADGLKKVDALPQLPERRQYLTTRALRHMVRVWAKQMNLSPGRVTLRDMRRKWGSCSSRDNITLNKALCYVPHHLAEYVVVHELVHMRVFNHGREFKAMMSQYLPDWKAREEELKKYPV